MNFIDKPQAVAAGLAPTPPASASEFRWIINGRFLTQRITGVQRYAREVVRAIDASSCSNGAALVVPDNVEALPHFANLTIKTLSGDGGVFWEQVRLPWKFRKPTLNLCTRGPVVASRQVLCIHDLNVLNAPDAYSPAFRLAYKSIVPLLAKRATSLTTVSAFAAKDISQKLDLPMSRISVLHNGHEHALRWRAERSDIFARMELDRPFVLTIGSRSRHKNLRLLVQLAPELDELGLDLVVAGGGNNIFADALGSDAPNVKALGYVSDDDLAALLQRALCLAFPSYTEGFGLPLVEAMAHQCPVVSSSAASMPEIGGDAVLYACPSDPAAWLKHFRALTASETLGDELRAKGQQRVKAFSWNSTADGYAALMHRLV